MKLRIKGNSLRFRLRQTELAALVDAGHIEETVYLGSEPNARMTYALEHQPSLGCTTLRYHAPELTIVLATENVRAWAETKEVGIYAMIDLGAHGSLEVAVEKDYACLDLSDGDNIDTFPNPNEGAVC
ncbi:DUF7009 family protein [Acidicapsa acidisoli]|uniref:DUF7009 family protein n=1 Tax=Acidicapsa acidisoli TaxID=1615681 RepID=UPI0021DF9868|nr:hypothetical protein [Acidicapsa acidisoli]